VLWLALVLLIVVSGTLWLHQATAPLDRIDAPVTDVVSSVRSDWLDAVARFLNGVASRGGLGLVGLATVAVAALTRQWRRLVVFLIGLVLLAQLSALLTIYAARPRPFGVTAIGAWEGYSAPSAPITRLAVVLLGAAYVLVVAGRPRMVAKLAIAVLAVGVGLARVELGVDHPSDVVFGLILGVAIPVALFRVFAPNDVFPVRYGKRGKTAHLDVGGRRGEAIREAMKEQLGLTILEMKPVGLEGSGGSTPLRMRVVDEEGATRSVFAKLYAENHVRADYWYKLGRLMLYGRLEDETPFKTVRRFVEYEDYTLRLLRESGISVPAPLGIVEITPEREYLIAMEFFDDAVEVGAASVDERVIDEGLLMIRRMWDLGLAHRDVKPANLMVQDGHLRLIDVFFVQVRPSPWRQAVDLGNMMLVLALRSDAETVYRKALRYFTPEELAEAFAATRGVASPSQLRRSMKQDGRNLLEEFRRLAPARRPIAIQRWSARRVALIVIAIVLVSLAATFGVTLLFPGRGNVLRPACGTGRTMQLMAQSVPSATRLPCVRSLPVGWVVASTSVASGRATFMLEFDVGLGQPPGPDELALLSPVTVTLTATCPPPGADTTILRVDGGCVTYRTSISEDDGLVPSFDADGGLSFVERVDLVALVDREEQLTLCGAGAPPCGP
jgi:membrane-associated phospholipid phosphatase/tRNA A-37 threonylcarbamoyl transferase component Bud32